MNFGFYWVGAALGLLSLVVSLATYYATHSVREAVLELRVGIGKDLAAAKTEAQKWVEERFVRRASRDS